MFGQYMILIIKESHVFSYYKTLFRISSCV